MQLKAYICKTVSLLTHPIYDTYIDKCRVYKQLIDE